MSVLDQRADWWAEQLRSRRRDLNPPGGDGTSGDVTDDWKESVDRQLAQLHGDVRTMLAAGIAAVLLLLGAIGGLYVHTDAKFDAAAVGAKALARGEPKLIVA